MDRVDCVVVGAGVVGLAIARAIAGTGSEVIVIESEAAIGTGVSSRNSEVVHAGIYYEPGSLKARLCTEGRRLLYAYCDAHTVAYRRTEKLIVGTQPDHEGRLAQILSRAIANGVEEIDWIGAPAARALEPALHCNHALYSRQTGIVDTHGLMEAFRHDIERAGGIVALKAPLVRAEQHNGEWKVRIGGDDPMHVQCRWLVNSAGLFAQQVAARIDPLDATHIPAQTLARGCYFALAGASPFSRLIYPVPVDGGLGVHLTLDLGGQARFGPDVEWINEIDYTVNPVRAQTFYHEIRQYWPALPDESLKPSFAGIRPKLSGPGQPARDFVIAGPDTHGLSGLVNLFGIESPGLTASPAIGRYVADIISAHQH